MPCLTHNALLLDPSMWFIRFEIKDIWFSLSPSRMSVKYLHTNERNSTSSLKSTPIRSSTFSGLKDMHRTKQVSWSSCDLVTPKNMIALLEVFTSSQRPLLERKIQAGATECSLNPHHCELFGNSVVLLLVHTLVHSQQRQRLVCMQASQAL